MANDEKNELPQNKKKKEKKKTYLADIRLLMAPAVLLCTIELSFDLTPAIKAL